jgi:hypothetical protein
MHCPSHPQLNWAAFTNGQEKEKGDYLKALETCPNCLKLFSSFMENNLVSPPAGFVHKVMAGLPATDLPATGKVGRSLPWFSPWLHYVAAACVTMVLLHLGYFDYISRLPVGLQSLEHGIAAEYHIQSVLDKVKDYIYFHEMGGI